MITIKKALFRCLILCFLLLNIIILINKNDLMTQNYALILYVVLYGPISIIFYNGFRLFFPFLGAVNIFYLLMFNITKTSSTLLYILLILYLLFFVYQLLSFYKNKKKFDSELSLYFTKQFIIKHNIMLFLSLSIIPFFFDGFIYFCFMVAILLAFLLYSVSVFSLLISVVTCNFIFSLIHFLLKSYYEHISFLSIDLLIYILTFFYLLIGILSVTETFEKKELLNKLIAAKDDLQEYHSIDIIELDKMYFTKNDYMTKFFKKYFITMWASTFALIILYSLVVYLSLLSTFLEKLGSTSTSFVTMLGSLRLSFPILVYLLGFIIILLPVIFVFRHNLLSMFLTVCVANIFFVGTIFLLFHTSQLILAVGFSPLVTEYYLIIFLFLAIACNFLCFLQASIFSFKIEKSWDNY